MSLLSVIAYQIAGGMIGGALFICCWLGWEKCTHDGKGRTLNAHVTSIFVLMAGIAVGSLGGTVAGGMAFSIAAAEKE